MSKNSVKRNSKKSVSKRLLKHAGQVALGIISTTLIVSSAGAVDAAADGAKEIAGSEGGKASVTQALKVARSRPSLSIAAIIVCIACIPVTGAITSPGMCIACGILITKVIG
jgi:hypothetical protein